jgi:isochorismate hydrolase
VFRKHVNSAFIGTGLEAYLQTQGIRDLVLVGLTTDHCVSTSARMAANLGFAVTVVADEEYPGALRGCPPPSWRSSRSTAVSRR